MSECTLVKVEVWQCKECLVEANRKKCPNIVLSSPCTLTFVTQPCTRMCHSGIVARCPIAIRKNKYYVEYLKPKWVKLNDR